jgi:hypothetical protein
VPLALLVATPTALAFDTGRLGQWGSLFLEHRSQPNDAVSEIKKKPEEVRCFGMRFPGAWKNLGGLCVAPYACDFGAKWLQIHATVRITDRRGFRLPATGRLGWYPLDQSLVFDVDTEQWSALG